MIATTPWRYLLVFSCEKIKIEKDDFKIANGVCEKLKSIPFDDRKHGIELRKQARKIHMH